jgi:hypothetical protein
MPVVAREVPAMIDDVETRAEKRNSDRRYERWQEANARADRRRLVGEKIALGVIAVVISAWTVLQVLR